MPNLIERRRMKRRLMTMGQQPVYNIYYTDPQAIRQLPNFTQNLVRTYPQLEQSIYPVPKIQDSFSIPQNNQNYISVNNNNQEYFSALENNENFKRTEEMPFFPEEHQRRCKSVLKNHTVENPHIPRRQSSLPKNCFGCKSSTERRDNCLMTTSESRRSCDRVNSNNPHITLPTQPIGSNHGYSMKIQVLTTPFKAKEANDKKLYEGDKSMSEFDSDSDFTKSEVPLQFEEKQNRICPRISEAKKRDSILSKLKRKIKKKRSRTIVDYPDDSSRSNSALEILSPRQLIESTTNVCSSIENSEIEPEDSSLVAINFEEALKNLEETLKIDAETTKFKKTSSHRFSSTFTPFVCEGCKLKNYSDLHDRSSLRRVRNLSRSCCNHSQENYHDSDQPWNLIRPEETLDHSLFNINCKTRRDRQLFRDHSPPERDEPTSALKKNIHPQDTNNHNGACCRFPDSNLACCGLVMYGQEQPILKSTKEERCTKSIPVCGTVSQGLSPGYEPNNSPPSYHNRDLPHCHQRYRRRFDTGTQHSRLRRECKCANRNEQNLEFPTSPVLKTLAKAANLMLTSIFGRTKSHVHSKRQNLRNVEVHRNEEFHEKKSSVRQQKSQNPLIRERL